MGGKKESIVVTVNLKQGMVNIVDELASELGIKSNKLIGNLIGIGFDEIKALKKYGILKKGLFVMNVLEQYGLLEKKEKEETEKYKRSMPISIRIGKELDESLGKWSIELGKTKNSVIVICLSTGLDDFKLLKNIGVFNMALGLVKFEDSVKELFNEARIKEIWSKRFKKAGSISNKMLNVNLE